MYEEGRTPSGDPNYLLAYKYYLLYQRAEEADVSHILKRFQSQGQLYYEDSFIWLQETFCCTTSFAFVDDPDVPVDDEKISLCGSRKEKFRASLSTKVSDVNVSLLSNANSVVSSDAAAKLGDLVLTDPSKARGSIKSQMDLQPLEVSAPQLSPMATPRSGTRSFKEKRGSFFDSGKSPIKDKEYEDAIAGDDFQKCIALGNSFLLTKSKFVGAKAFRLFQNAIKSGSCEAQLGLGKCFYFGLGTTQNYSESIFFFKQASPLSIEAKGYLGLSLYYGYGIPKDVHAAIPNLELAHTILSDAAFALGLIYFNGEAPAIIEMELAFKYFQLASEGKNYLAIFWLGKMFFHGLGTKQDTSEAFRCFKEASDRGIVEAAFHLGQCYITGTGCNHVDLDAGFELIRHAASKGNDDAISILKSNV